MRHRGACPAARYRAGSSEERSLSGSARFLGSFPRADVVLEASFPEIAFLGRSNVGKSSLLNALLRQKIARISATPGKTRALNVYEVPVPGGWGAGAEGAPPTTHRALYLLDLPGYGYARASQADRRGYRGLVMHVVERVRLAGVVWLLDIRRDPSPDDRTMQDVFIETGTKVLAALTKSDKLPRGQRLERERSLRAQLALPDDQVVVTSAQTGDGMNDLREAMVGLIQ